MTEWIDPRYADLVAEWDAARTTDSRDPDGPQPVRGFIVPRPSGPGQSPRD
ncbi:hypothetical protein ACIBEA_19680 [Streptomyces sp. NPDC051555]|uniref:hypothetical protein n=1 Tax=Streptomyces sp. NPDC051555 TaxID=3365657 RepID=UPI0037A64301